MDPAEFGYSTLEMKHAPYGPITSEALKDSNVGKVAVVTGAAQGIGAAIAKALAKSGASVAILDLSVEKLTKTKEECEQQGVKVQAYACDVTNEDWVKEVFDQVEKELGNICTLVNNAGILDQRPFIMSDFSSFWRQIEVNFKAVCISFKSLPYQGRRIRRHSYTFDSPIGLITLNGQYYSDCSTRPLLCHATLLITLSHLSRCILCSHASAIEAPVVSLTLHREVRPWMCQ
jgi:NAD(P)-dependent dehydrogenase (short-subunit alcohol dehydrogenase family)